MVPVAIQPPGPFLPATTTFTRLKEQSNNYIFAAVPSGVRRFTCKEESGSLAIRELWLKQFCQLLVLLLF
jgi:hypothetical protein